MMEGVQMAGLAAPAFHLSAACRISFPARYLSCSTRYLARRAREIRSHQKYPTRKPKGKPIKNRDRQVEHSDPGTLLGWVVIHTPGCCVAGDWLPAPYCRASPRGAS